MSGSGNHTQQSNSNDFSHSGNQSADATLNHPEPSFPLSPSLTKSPVTQTLQRTFHSTVDHFTRPQMQVTLHHLYRQSSTKMSSMWMSFIDCIAIPCLMVLRIVEGINSVLTASVSSIKDCITFEAERFEVFLKPIAQECDKCSRIVMKALSLGGVTLSFPFTLTYSLSSIVLPTPVASALSELAEAVDETRTEMISGTKTVYQSISGRLSAWWSNLTSRIPSASPSASISSQQTAFPSSPMQASSTSASPQSEPSHFERRRPLINLTERTATPKGIRERVEATSKLYQFVDHGTSKMERILGQSIRGATESVALKLGSYGESWSKQLIDTRVRNWNIRCEEQHQTMNQDEMRVDHKRRRSLTFSKAISQPLKASNPSLFYPYANLRVSFYHGYWRPASELFPPNAEDQNQQNQETLPEFIAPVERPTRFGSMIDDAIARERTSSVRSSIFSPGSLCRFDSDMGRRVCRSGTETPSAWRGGPVVPSSSVTPSSSPQRRPTFTPTLITESLIHEEQEDQNETPETTPHLQTEQHAPPKVGTFSPLFPYFKVTMNGIPIYRTPPAQLSHQGDFQWNMSFSLECRHPLDQFSLTLLDYDYVTDNSEVVSILSLPTWRIPQSDKPVEGWLPIWIGPSERTTPASGILWVYIGLQMKFHRVDSELMALLLPPPKSIGNTICHPKHETTPETDLLPTSAAELGVYKAAENGMQQFAFRRDQWAHPSDQKKHKHSSVSKQSSTHGNVVGQTLTSYIRLQRDLWTLLGTPVFLTCRAILQWRYPLVSIAALLSFWCVWLQPSSILPASIGLLGLHYMNQYLCLIEFWSDFPYPLSTLLKFVLKWSEDEEDDDDEDQLIMLEQSKMNSSISLISQTQRLSIASSSSLGLNLTAIARSEVGEGTSTSLAPQFGYKTKMISRLLPQPIKEILRNASVLCDKCADAIEKANAWNIHRSRTITLTFGFVGLVLGSLLWFLTQNWTTTVPQLVLNGVLFVITTVYLGTCLSLLFLGTFVLIFWSKPVRAALRFLHALRMLWLINRARNDGSVILLSTMDP